MTFGLVPESVHETPSTRRGIFATVGGFRPVRLVNISCVPGVQPKRESFTNINRSQNVEGAKPGYPLLPLHFYSILAVVLDGPYPRVSKSWRRYISVEKPKNPRLKQQTFSKDMTKLTKKHFWGRDKSKTLLGNDKSV